MSMDTLVLPHLVKLKPYRLFGIPLPKGVQNQAYINLSKKTCILSVQHSFFLPISSRYVAITRLAYFTTERLGPT